MEPTVVDDRKSAFVLGLAESQGTLAVVAALLAGFSYSGLCSVSRAEMEEVNVVVQYAFVLSTAVSASMALSVTIVCSLCEQEGRIARSFAVLRSFEPDFEDTVYEWWKSFAPVRTHVVFLFIYTIPFFFMSMACIALIKLPLGPCLVALVAFALAGSVVFRQIVSINENFRFWIVRFFSGQGPPCQDATPFCKDVPTTDMPGQFSRSLFRSVTQPFLNGGHRRVSESANFHRRASEPADRPAGMSVATVCASDDSALDASAATLNEAFAQPAIRLQPPESPTDQSILVSPKIMPRRSERLLGDSSLSQDGRSPCLQSHSSVASSISLRGESTLTVESEQPSVLRRTTALASMDAADSHTRLDSGGSPCRMATEQPSLRLRRAALTSTDAANIRLDYEAYGIASSM